MLRQIVQVLCLLGVAAAAFAQASPSRFTGTCILESPETNYAPCEVVGNSIHVYFGDTGFRNLPLFGSGTDELTVIRHASAYEPARLVYQWREYRLTIFPSSLDRQASVSKAEGRAEARVVWTLNRAYTGALIVQFEACEKD